MTEPAQSACKFCGSPHCMGPTICATAQSEVIALRAQVAELTRDRDHQKERNESHLRLLERYASIEGKEHLQTIDERDSAEQAISQAYYLIKGESPQWSNLFGYEQAIEDIDDAQRCLRAEISQSGATVKALREALEEIQVGFHSSREMRKIARAALELAKETK